MSEGVEYRVVARGLDARPEEDHAALTEYFMLGTSLHELSNFWASRDSRFSSVRAYFPGARVLQQDPVECLFQFICSSNNHISRIHGMVERLCAMYGTRLQHFEAPASPATGFVQPSEPQEELAYHAFPTLAQLAGAQEDALRAGGFGYRAKFVTGSVAALRGKPGGGEAWLAGLRMLPYPDAAAALCTLPGVGPKVAACICLFSLGHAQAIPVDTHVWQLATRYYTPHLKGKALNKAVMGAVEAALQERFGAYAGWAHNTLFISELASQRYRLPQHLQPRGSASRPVPAAKAAGRKRATGAAEPAAPVNTPAPNAQAGAYEGAASPQSAAPAARSRVKRAGATAPRGAGASVVLASHLAAAVLAARAATLEESATPGPVSGIACQQDPKDGAGAAGVAAEVADVVVQSCDRKAEAVAGRTLRTVRRSTRSAAARQWPIGADAPL